MADKLFWISYFGEVMLLSNDGISGGFRIVDAMRN